jgi:SPP1 family predicted phage head-tail adaptor
MTIGGMRHFMTFENKVSEFDSDGATVETWEPAFGGRQISVEIAPLSGRELIAAQAVQSKVTTRLKVRYRPGFSASMRGLHRDVIYDIAAVVPDSKSGIDWINLLVSSGVNEG